MKLNKVLAGVLILLAGFVGIAKADSSTSRLSLTKPSAGSTSWGTKLNTDLDTIDAGVAVLASTNNFTAVQTFTAGAVVPSSAAAATSVPRFSQVKILQIVNAAVTSASSTVNSTSYVPTALSASITLQATSSRVLILVSGELQVNNASSFGHLTILRNGTNLAGNDGMCVIGAGASTDSAIQTCSIAYMDSPASVSALTYKAAMKVQGSATVGFPGGSVGASTASMTLIEVNGL
jgi:hypothetical protein